MLEPNVHPKLYSDIGDFTEMAHWAFHIGDTPYDALEWRLTSLLEHSARA